MVTRSFREKLESLRLFLLDRDAQQAYERLVDDLLLRLAPDLSRFPLMGGDLLAKLPGSVEGVSACARLRERLPPDASLRQVITSDYLVLYLAAEREIVLLSIRHHRQLALDLEDVWEE